VKRERRMQVQEASMQHLGTTWTCPQQQQQQLVVVSGAPALLLGTLTGTLTTFSRSRRGMRPHTQTAATGTMPTARMEVS
jgi:hypothetical protein